MRDPNAPKCGEGLGETPMRSSPLTNPRPPDSGWLADYCNVDILGPRYKSVNLGVRKDPDAVRCFLGVFLR